MCLTYCVCLHYNYVLWSPPYLTFKSEETVSQINDSESLKYNPSDNNEVVLLDEASDPDSNFHNANVQ